MPSFDISDELKIKMRKLLKKDKKKVEIIHKKICEIVNSPPEVVEHYKNLRYSMSNMKRVHVDKHFVLTFTYDKNQNHILFLDFDHHDNIYQ